MFSQLSACLPPCVHLCVRSFFTFCLLRLSVFGCPIPNTIPRLLSPTSSTAIMSVSASLGRRLGGLFLEDVRSDEVHGVVRPCFAELRFGVSVLTALARVQLAQSALTPLTYVRCCMNLLCFNASSLRPVLDIQRCAYCTLIISNYK